MQLISKDNKGVRYFVCAIDLFRRYAWVAPLKDQKRIAIVNVFHKILDNSKKKKKKGSSGK